MCNTIGGLGSGSLPQLGSLGSAPAAAAGGGGSAAAPMPTDNVTLSPEALASIGG